MSEDQKATELWFKAVEEQNRSLAHARELAENRIANEWEWPKRAVIAISFLAGGFAILTFINQYLVVTEISQRSSELYKELDKAKEVVASAEATIDDAQSKLDSEIDAYKVSFNEKLDAGLDSLSQKFVASHQEVMLELEDAQRILSLVSMGREQVFLKRNPTRALLYADAATNIYNKRMVQDLQPPPSDDSDVGDAIAGVVRTTPGSVLKAVYPAVWNLRMECLLQTSHYPKLLEEADNVIASATNGCVRNTKHCTLRPAFYYRALAQVDLMSRFHEGVNSDRQNRDIRDSAFNELVTQIIDDLESGVGEQADQSIGTIYLALMFMSDGQYSASRKVLGKLPTDDDNFTIHSTDEQKATVKLAATIKDLLDFIENKDLSLDSLGCRLDASALTPWDGYLLERLVGEVIKKRYWHIAGGRIKQDAAANEAHKADLDDLTNQLGVFCVDWSVSLRSACKGETHADSQSVSCRGGGCGGSTNNVPPDAARNQLRAELMAEHGLGERAGGIVFSRDRSLGRIYRRYLWMKLTGSATIKRLVTEERTKTIFVTVESGEQEERVVTYSTNVPVYEQVENAIMRFDLDTNIPAGTYARVVDDDIARIDRMIAEKSEIVAAGLPVDTENEADAPAPPAEPVPEPVDGSDSSEPVIGNPFDSSDSSATDDLTEE